MFFYFLVFIFLGSLFAFGANLFLSKTKAIPKIGGEYIEGIIGQPLHINPVISQSNSTDQDLVHLVYNSLFKYDNEGHLANDLAEKYEISEDKLSYTINLKKNIFWHDGEELNSDDIVFTASLIATSSYKSPIKSTLQGVEVKALDDYTVVFSVKEPYVGFLNNLTFGILPKHIWQDIEPENFPLTDLNLQPIGTGPYKYLSMQKDSKGNIISYKLVSNPKYFEGKPYISKMTFNFYTDDNSITEALNRKEIMGINSISSQRINSIKVQKSTQIHKFDMPRYFAVFINKSKSIPLAHKEVREALAYATNREEMIKKVLEGNGKPVYSPILPDMVGYTDEIEKYGFSIEKADQILEDNGWVKGDDGIRKKGETRLEFNLITVDSQDLSKTAEILKEQWEKIGIRVNVSVFSFFDVQQNYMRPREYDAILFGQALNGDPNLYSFWHSSQKKDLGLNLSLFGDDDTDKMIVDAMAEFDMEKRASIYREFQKTLSQEIPAVFLYSPSYIYPVNKRVKGIGIKNITTPSDRFFEASKWYIKTKRVLK